MSTSEPASRGPGNFAPGPPDLRAGNKLKNAWSMLHGILGFLPFVLDLAGIFLGLALNCLSLVLSLLAQAHDRLLSVLRCQRCHIRTASPLRCRRRGAPMASGSTPDEAQTFQLSRRQIFSCFSGTRASAGKAPDPEGRMWQRQAARDR